MKIIYNFDTKAPVRGYCYMVCYLDTLAQKTKIAAAVWKKPDAGKGYFDYCMKGRFTDGKTPQPTNTSRKYRVEGWANVMKDWEDE